MLVCRRKAMDNIPADVKKMMEEGTLLIIDKKYAYQVLSALDDSVHKKT